MDTYKIIVKQKGKPDTVRTGIDKLNSIIIPAELKMTFPKASEKGIMKVIVVKE